MFFIFTEQDSGCDVVVNADSITHIRVSGPDFFRIFVAGNETIKITRNKLKDLLEQLSARNVMIDLSGAESGEKTACNTGVSKATQIFLNKVLSGLSFPK